MNEDEFFKLYPNYLKDKRFVDKNGNIYSPALQNAIKNKYGLPLNQLTEEMNLLLDRLQYLSKAINDDCNTPLFVQSLNACV